MKDLRRSSEPGHPKRAGRENSPESGISLVEVVAALALAAGGIVGTASTLLKCNNLQVATRMATEDRQLTREVFSKLRGTGWSTSFAELHACALTGVSESGKSLPGERTQTVTFPATDLAMLLDGAASAGSRFRDIDDDGVIDLDTASTSPGLFPVLVTIQRPGRTVSYFSLVRTP